MAMGERLSTIAPTREKIVPGSGWTKDSDNHYLLVDLPGFQMDKVKVEVDMTAGHITVTGERQLNEREHVYFEENFTMPADSDVDKISGKFDHEILHLTVPRIVAVVQADKKQQPEKTVQETKEPQIVQEKTEPQVMQQATKQHETLDNQKNILGRAAAAATATAAAESARLRATENIDKNQAKKIYDTSEAELKKILIFDNARIYFSPENIKKWEDENGIIRNAIEMLNRNKGIIISAVVAFSLGVIVSRKFDT